MLKHVQIRTLRTVASFSLNSVLLRAKEKLPNLLKKSIAQIEKSFYSCYDFQVIILNRISKPRAIKKKTSMKSEKVTDLYRATSKKLKFVIIN